MGTVTHNTIGMGRIWLAMDDSRHLGVLISGMEGPVPRSVLQEGAVDGLLLAALERLEELTVVNSRGGASGLDGLGARGLYVLRWAGDAPVIGKVPGVYEVVEEPSYGLSVDQLPGSLARIARLNRLPGVNFAAALRAGVRIPPVLLVPGSK